MMKKEVKAKVERETGAKQFLRRAKAFSKGLLKTSAAFGSVLVLSSSAWAYTIPTSGFIYDLYDIFVNKMVKGPVGTAVGVAAMVYGGINLFLSRWSHAVFPILGGAMIIKADSIASSVGMTIKHF